MSDRSTTLPASLTSATGPGDEPSSGAPDDGVSILRVEEHFARIEETRSERNKLAWGYRWLAKEANDDLVKLTGELVAANREVDRLVDRYWRQWEDEESERAAAVVGAENAATRKAKAVELATRDRDRYAKAADELRKCSEGLMVGKAGECALSCLSHGVAGCNRIMCPLCAPKRAGREVATYAPAIGDLMDARVWMLSVRNVGEGELDDAVRTMTGAFQKLARSKWFRDRFDSGIRSLEVTAGAAPSNVRRTDEKTGRAVITSGWHPHFHAVVGNLDERESPDGDWDPRRVGRYKRELETAWGRALGVIRHRRDCPVRTHEPGCVDVDELAPKRLACDVCRAANELRETERECPAGCGAYRPIVWVDRPHFTERGGRVKVYADDLGNDDPNRARAFEHAARECLKYITKGVSKIPKRMLPELIQAKERRRWMQSFGGLHEQGMRACAKCETRWRLKDKGPTCPKCDAPGVLPRELVEKEPWRCSHDHDFTVDGYVVPERREDWAALNPSGLLIRRRRSHKTGPPSKQGRLLK